MLSSSVKKKIWNQAFFQNMAFSLSFSPKFQNPNPKFSSNFPNHHQHHQHHCRRFTTICKFYTNKNTIKDNESIPPSPPPTISISTTAGPKRSLAVATGELFLGLASRIIKSTNNGRYDSEVPIKMFRETEKLVEKEVELGEVAAEAAAEEYLAGRRRVVVVENEDMGIDSEVIWEQPMKDLEAERQRKKITSPGFSFSAAGLLFPYHLGVAQFLIEKGYIKETTPLAGSSAGAIVCAVIASGSSMEEALKATKILANDCRLKGTAFRLGSVLRNVLEEFLPDDVHVRSNGRVRIAVTQIFWRPRGLLVDQFDSKEDLINAVFTSSFIPGYLAPRPATFFRNRLCVDGGLTLFMPPTSAAKTVRVCAFPTDRLGFKGIGISPDCNPENRATARQLFNWALEPAEDDVLDRLFELGYLDAAVWAEQNPVDETVEDYENTAIADLTL